MDVVPPEPMAVKQAPPDEDTGETDQKEKPESQSQPADAKSKTKPPKQPATPKQPKNGVGMAIAGTVIIVLGIAALATYAFLKTR